MLKLIKHFLRQLAGPLPAEEVRWVVNDIGELGVRINNTTYFMYKGESLVYNEPYDNGAAMMQRPVGKREFGEVCRVPGIVIVNDNIANYREGDGWFPLTKAA